MVVVGDEGAVIVVEPGFDANAVHVPVPLAAIVAIESRQMVWSGPALLQLLTVTVPLAVAEQPIGLVAVTVYVPAVPVVMLTVAADVLHR